MIKKIIDKIKIRRDPIRFWRDRGAKIGCDCFIGPSVLLGTEPYLVSIGNHVRINRGVTISTHDGGVWVLRALDEELKDADLFGSVSIGDNVHIGSNAFIMPGVSIGNNCIIGVGAIITKNVPDNSVVVGIPGRVIETIDTYKNKHKDAFHHCKFLSEDEKRKYLEELYSENKL